MLQEAILEPYLDQIQHIQSEGRNDEDAQHTILELIEKHLNESQDDTTVHALFLGERAFYQHQYKIALKYYMEAKGIPFFHFFCYRACSFLFEYDQKTEKALDFAQKALSIRSDDWTTLQLVRRLTETNFELSEELESSLGSDTDDLTSRASSPIMLATEEFNELSQLFWDAEQSLKSPVRATTEEHKIRHPSPPRYETQLRLGDDALGRRIQSFIDLRKRTLHDYIAQTKLKSVHQDYLFHVLEGWHTSTATSDPSLPPLLQHASKPTTGGYFLKWHRKGIAINPGPHFLESMHRQGFFITDIDAVIVTKGSPSSSADVNAIYRLNAQINSANTPIHIIHYYLCQPAYQLLARTLKPQFKQERSTVHCLELYRDSPEIETIAISDGIQLSYFSTKPIDTSTEQTSNEFDEAATPIGIRLDLRGPAQGANVHPVRVGYLGGSAWSPVVAHYIAQCDLLIAGIEKVHDDATQFSREPAQALGFAGTLSLLEASAPRLLLCCEFSGTEGDFRLEFVQKLRRDHQPHSSRSTTVLPGDTGLTVDLTTLQVRCTASDTFVDPAQIHVARSGDHWNALQYLSPQHIL